MPNRRPPFKFQTADLSVHVPQPVRPLVVGRDTVLASLRPLTALFMSGQRGKVGDLIV